MSVSVHVWSRQIIKHLVPLFLLLVCLFLSPLALFFFSFSSPHVLVFLPVSLYPSLYPSAIIVMTHVARTCSAVEGSPWFYKEWLETLKVWSKSVQGEAGEWEVSVHFSPTVAIFDLQTWCRRQCSSYTRHHFYVQVDLPYFSENCQKHLILPNLHTIYDSFFRHITGLNGRSKM